jgi:hypothetical protein
MPYTTENPAAVKNYRHVGSAVGKFCISSREGVPNCKLFQKNISGHFGHPLSGGRVKTSQKRFDIDRPLYNDFNVLNVFNFKSDH